MSSEDRLREIDARKAALRLQRVAIDREWDELVSERVRIVRGISRAGGTIPPDTTDPQSPQPQLWEGSD